MTHLTELALDPRYDATREIRAPRGAKLTCRSWLTEAAYRMIQNNLDPEVAENPKHLVVYGGIGRAARDWASFDRILAALKDLGDDESLLIQSGKPVGVFPDPISVLASPSLRTTLASRGRARRCLARRCLAPLLRHLCLGTSA